MSGPMTLGPVEEDDGPQFTNIGPPGLGPIHQDSDSSDFEMMGPGGSKGGLGWAKGSGLD